ncbi:GTP cyclohydrolase [Massilia sp. WF1]|uniref:GTP cyclohydrolase I n=1 Tax=unclassified Massilia TaxID=2609279 RepID=UPI0006499704|nr:MULTISPECIES: GTP cyclohydrolase I [unclassified Massilia]ALK99186.1 GTP cyclohydrolase [Massilia sp. WG5]KLU35094.1 GTP cyclohydrolase [Massilia sp. WF1]
MPNDLLPPFDAGNLAQDTPPVSQRIRARLKAGGARFFANDNIADFLAPGELDELVEEVSRKMQEVLDSLVIDTSADHNTRDTGRRVASMFVREVFAGRYEAMPAATAFPNVTHSDELMVVGPITVRSACSHHLCPVIGKIWVGLLPNPDAELIGLSKYARLSNWIMSRPQIQEEAVIQLADALEALMAPRGLALLMEADHFCMQWRGVMDMDASMGSTVMRGAFRQDPALRAEFHALLRRSRGA